MIRRWFSLFAVQVTILGCIYGFPSPSKAEKSPDPMFKWDAKSETSFVQLLCGDGEYFRECFSVSRQNCERTLKAEARACANSISDSKRKSFKSEVQMFAEIGLCAGLRIENVWRDRKTNSSKCDNKENWQ